MASHDDPNMANDADYAPPTSAPSATMGAHILRRRDRDEKSPFGIASRTFEALRGRVEDAGKRVTLDSITNQVANLAGREKKDRDKAAAKVAPLGVTQSYSLVLTHIIAPLWSVGTRPTGVYPPINLLQDKFFEMARSMDSKGPNMEFHIPRLASNQQVVTVYIILLLAKLLCVEGGDNGTASFEDLLTQTAEFRPRQEYEEHANDETVAHDQPRRKLTEVGGTWKAKGAADLHYRSHQLRHKLLADAMKASVCFKYYYNEEHVQFLCDTLCTKLFLVGYSETFVQLVAGIKGAMYVGKYMLLKCSPSFPNFTHHHSMASAAEAVQPDPSVASALLTEVKQLAGLALDNIIHRNDTGDIIIAAMTKCTPHCPPASIPALFTRFLRYLQTVYVVDMQALATLMDVVRKFALQKEPVGSTALALMQELSKAMRFPGSTQRSLASAAFVGGNEIRSFRLQPAHIITTPYAARSATFIQSMLSDPVGLQRAYGGAAPFAEREVPLEQISGCGMLPTAFSPQGKFATSNGGAPSGGSAITAEQFLACGQSPHFVDDVTLYISNLCINLFQAAVEILGDIDPKVGSIDLGFLFAIPPHVLCRFYPALHQLVTTHQRNIQQMPVSAPSSQASPDNSTVINTMPTSSSLRTLFTYPDAPQLISALYSTYLTICDQCVPEKGQKRFRLESPRVPNLPLLLNVCTEQDDMNEFVKDIMERHWRYCDSRIVASEKEVSCGAAYLHPSREMSLSHFIENEIRLVIVGGSGTLRAVVSSIMQLQNLYPGTLLKPKLYLLPFGFDNDMVSWLARHDPIYYEDVMCPLLLDPIPNVDAPLVEQMKISGSLQLLTASHPGLASIAPPAAVTVAPVPPTSVPGKRAGVVVEPIVEVKPPLTVYPPLKTLLARDALNKYLLHATHEIRIIIYQAECVSSVDGKVSVVPFTSNFEVGTHITQALRQMGTVAGTLFERYGSSLQSQSSMLGNSVAGGGNNNNSVVGGNYSSMAADAAAAMSSPASPSGGGAHDSTFANSFIGTVAKSFTSKVTNVGGLVAGATGLGGAGSSSSAAAAAAASRLAAASEISTTNCTTGAKGNLASPIVAFGTTAESVDRILIRLHGVKGVKLGVRRHISDPRRGDIRHACSGVELLDWISTTYHVYEASIAVRAVQSLIEFGVFICASAPHGNDNSRFSENAIYTIREREEADSQPRLTPSSRGIALQLASKHHQDAVDLIAAREGFTLRGTFHEGADGEGEGNAAGDAGGGGGGGTGGSRGGGAGEAGSHSTFQGNSGAAGGATAGGPGGAGGAAGGGGELPSLRVRVSLKGGANGDLRYTDIDEEIAKLDVLKRVQRGGDTSSAPEGVDDDDSAAVAASVNASLVRDVVSIKIRSSGGGGDHGPMTDPTVPKLQMSILQGERKKRWGGTWGAGGGTLPNSASRSGKEPSGLYENYTLNFGDSAVKGAPTTTTPQTTPSDILPILARAGACLNIEHEGFKSGGAGQKDRAGSLDGYGLLCAADGDIFGPFSSIRIRPITLNSAGPVVPPLQPGMKGSSQLAAAIPPANQLRTCATVSVMSFMKPSSAPTKL